MISKQSSCRENCLADNDFAPHEKHMTFKKGADNAHIPQDIYVINHGEN